MLSPGPVRLQLLVGPVPVPVPRAVLDAVQEVKVESGSGETQSGFEITFRISNRSPLHTLFLLTGGSSIPVLRVVIAVTVGGETTVLMDGVMTHHEVRSDGGPTSTMVVKGKDTTALMDIVPLDGLPYPAMPPAVRVLLALAKYAAFGIVPLVIPSVLEDVPIPIERIPRHQGTDYAYLRALAKEVGYVFYIDPGPVPGVSKAPIPIPIPDVTPLNPPLGVVPPLPPKITFLKDTAKLNPLVAAMRGLAYAGQHTDAVFGTGSLDVARYGHVLKSRQLVGVRGAGEAFDGLHYVTSVTSTLKRGEFTQSFSLARNGLLSTLPAVPP